MYLKTPNPDLVAEVCGAFDRHDVLESNYLHNFVSLCVWDRRPDITLDDARTLAFGELQAMREAGVVNVTPILEYCTLDVTRV